MYKLRIKFNDEATTMFEYPSEASLVVEEMTTHAHSSGSGESSSQPAQASATPPSSSPGLAMSLGLSPPDFLPPPVPDRSYNTLIPSPPLTPVEHWPPPKLSATTAPHLISDTVVKDRAPKPPVQKLSVIRPQVPSRSPLRRFRSDTGKTTAVQLVSSSSSDVEPEADKLTVLIAKRDPPPNIPVLPTTLNKDKYFSIKKTRHCEITEPQFVPCYVSSVAFHQPQRKCEDTDPIIICNDKPVVLTSNKDQKPSQFATVTSAVNKEKNVSIKKINSEKPQSITLSYYYPSSILNDHNSRACPKLVAPVYCPVYSKLSPAQSSLSKNPQSLNDKERKSGALDSCELKVDPSISSVFAKKPVHISADTSPTEPGSQVLVLDDWPCGTESLV